jgi:hypothetical protein
VLLKIIRAAYATNSIVREIVQAKEDSARRLLHDLIKLYYLKIEIKDIKLEDRLAYY